MVSRGHRLGWAGAWVGHLAGVSVDFYAVVEDSVIFEDVRVGRDAELPRHHRQARRGAAGFPVGVDLVHDRSRFTVSDDGVAVIGKNEKVA